jgi:hypothetical protein
VRVDIPKPGIAVRIEIPREFLQGVVSSENSTSFITSNIRNDYYYYNVVDESKHWIYDWKGTNSTGEPRPSDGPCFKPNFSFYDPNAPYCVEIWNYLNYPGFKQPVPYFDYCANTNATRWVFNCFSAPKFVLFHNLNSPGLAGLYNFTLFVANRTNTLGYPDFIHAYNTTLFVPVSMTYNAGFITGNICDLHSSCGLIRSKGIVYAANASTGRIVARAYVNQTFCKTLTICGSFKLTGLAPGRYQVEGSAGVDNGIAYSLTPYGYPTPQTIVVPANNGISIALPLRRSPLVCGTISYFDAGGITPIRSLTGQPYLLAAGFKSDPAFKLNVTVEGTDPSGHVFRFRGVSTDTVGDSFSLTTGVGVNYVGTDPYGTEFAGLAAPEDVGPYALNVKVWVSGYLQRTGFQSDTVQQSPWQPTSETPACSPSPNQPTVFVSVRMGGAITGTLQFCNTLRSCSLESPHDAEASLPITTVSDALFGGNIVVKAFDSSGILRGLTVINGTLVNGKTRYAGLSSLRFYITGFSEYYNHSLSGIWHQNDYGLPDGAYSLEVYVRGYELTSTSPSSITIMGGGNTTAAVYMTRGGAFRVTVGSFDNRFGTRAVQARLTWRFLNSSIPIRARVYFYAGGGARLIGYVERIMAIGVPDGVGTNSFTVVFAGQNWSLREIWFYGLVPSHITNDTYTIRANTLGYVRQFVDGINAPNELIGFSQTFVTLFIANEVDITVPVFSTPQSFTRTTEYDHAIGQVFSGSLSGAEMTNLTAGAPIVQFAIFGFGGMRLSNATECQTNVFLVGLLLLCGQGHFYYIGPDGTRYLDYGLDSGNYTAALPEFGFVVHFLQVLALPKLQFGDLFLQNGVFLKAIQMAIIMQGPASVVAGWTLFPTDVAPLSWAQVRANNSTYSRVVPTFDGHYDVVGALQLPAGTYNVTFTDVQYQSQTVYNFPVGWGSSYSLTPPQPLCPTGSTC